VKTNNQKAPLRRKGAKKKERRFLESEEGRKKGRGAKIQTSSVQKGGNSQKASHRGREKKKGPHHIIFGEIKGERKLQLLPVSKRETTKGEEREKGGEGKGELEFADYLFAHRMGKKGGGGGPVCEGEGEKKKAVCEE